ncbi:60S ribosomal protein L30 [Capsicum annuum]|nr:60S ribosomal protein L30 [Capsicum annuum]
MIRDFKIYGDIVSFDTTYRTNKEYQPLALPIGLNNHRKMVIFGAAFLYEESTESFEWLFNAFFRIMSADKPQIIFTAQDPAIVAAISLDCYDEGEVVTYNVSSLGSVKKHVVTVKQSVIQVSCSYIKKMVITKGKKSKRTHESINNRLSLVMKSGKYTLGYKTVLKTPRTSQGKLILVQHVESSTMCHVSASLTQVIPTLLSLCPVIIKSW